jgi:polyhydroxyalkanoate synthesis regulator protein
MSDLVAQFKASLPDMTAQDRADALKVIEEQIAMNMGNIQDMAKHLEGLTPKYRNAWAGLVENRRRDIEDLEQVKRLLSP